VVGDVEAVAERGYQGLRKLISALHVIEDFTPFERSNANVPRWKLFSKPLGIT
jgi:hypothetical protein